MTISPDVDLVKVKCARPNTSLVPNRIKFGDTYYRDERIILHGNSFGKGKFNNVDYGFFYTDSLLTDYAGIAELDLMEEVAT